MRKRRRGRGCVRYGREDVEVEEVEDEEHAEERLRKRDHHEEV